MKILIFTPYVGSNYGGTSKVVTGLAQGISSLGINVDIITTNANSSENLDIPINVWIDEKNYRIK